MREVPPEEWDGLELDAYYRRPYVESAALLDRGRPFLLEHEGAFFAGIERDDPRDVVTPYGYGGPTGDGFWDAYEDWARERGVVSTFVRFHPLLANQRGAPIHVEELAPTVAWRVEPERDLLAGLHFKHRNKVRKAENAGATVEQHDGLGEFVELYEDTMRRIDADPFYFFEPAYWERLGELPLARFDAAIDGEVVASRALPGEPAVAPLPPERHDRRGPLDRRLDARPARGRALGPGERLRALPPRRRPGRQGRLAAPLQGPLRPGRPRPGRGRQGDPRRGRLPRAERRRGAATRASSPLTATAWSSFTTWS